MVDIERRGVATVTYTREDQARDFIQTLMRDTQLFPRQIHALLYGLEALGIGLRAIGRGWASLDGSGYVVYDGHADPFNDAIARIDRQIARAVST